jgi:hypothetical protein
MPKQTLIEMVRANKPLVEVSITLADGVDSDDVLRQLNEEADDFHADYTVYRWIAGDKRRLSIETTPEALLRLFGWQIKRVNLERWNRETQKHEGVWDNSYRWEEVNKPTKSPLCLDGKVIEIRLSQPGASDEGQPYP